MSAVERRCEVVCAEHGRPPRLLLPDADNELARTRDGCVQEVAVQESPVGA